MNKQQKIRTLLNIFKYPFFLGAYSQLTVEERYSARCDAQKTLNVNNVSTFDVFVALVSNKNFARIFLYRLKEHMYIWMLCRVLFSYNKNIEINVPNIGEGVLIHHNLGCVIRAKKIGKNCVVSQGVTIGEGGDQYSKDNNNIPTIGDNVLVATNAIVIGNISIGNNAVIGAGAVVTKSVPEGAIVVGNPGRIIKYKC